MDVCGNIYIISMGSRGNRPIIWGVLCRTLNGSVAWFVVCILTNTITS